MRIAEEKYSPAPGEKPDDGSWWGIDGGFPETLIRDFEVSVAGKRLWLIRTLYRDLGSVMKAEVSEDDGKLVITLFGGDAAGSYSAVFTFREYEVERMVRAGEGPNSLWLRTVYRNSFEADVE